MTWHGPPFTPAPVGTVGCIVFGPTLDLPPQLKWCSYCQEDTHSDFECVNNRPAHWTPITGIGSPKAAHPLLKHFKSLGPGRTLLGALLVDDEEFDGGTSRYAAVQDET